MNGAEVLDVGRDAIWLTLQLCAPVLIVGHQPTLGMLAARLLTGQDLAWSVKKGGVWWLRSRERDGQTQVTLHAVQAPDFL